MNIQMAVEGVVNNVADFVFSDDGRVLAFRARTPRIVQMGFPRRLETSEVAHQLELVDVGQNSWIGLAELASNSERRELRRMLRSMGYMERKPLTFTFTSKW